MNLRPLLFFPPVALGILGFVWMTSRPDPEVATLPEASLAVRVMTVTPREISNSAVGYGRVESDHSWSAISEVQGRVIEVAEDINVGSIVEQGQQLIAVDRTDYELSLQKSRANIEAVAAQLNELERQEANSQALLVVETRILDVAQAEFDRVQSLLERGAGTQAALDATQKTLLGQEKSITSLRNTLALYPTQRASLQATLAVRQAELQETERLLEKSVISAPLRGRVSAMTAEIGQFVRVGDNLITLESTSAAEIVAEIQPRAFGAMMFGSPDVALMARQTVETSQFTELMKRAGVTATVSLDAGGISSEWSAEIVRLRGTMDRDTGAMGIVVRVDDPLTLTPGMMRPPLHSGSFVSVTLSVAAQNDVIAIPRHAVHLSDEGQAFVYLSNTASRLDFHDVKLGQVLGDDVIVSEGLNGGEVLVLGEPRPPVPGLKLTPIATTVAQQGN